MAQHDEVSGLRDIIRHDVMMDAKALKEIASLKQDISTSGIQDKEIFERLEVIEKCINSTLSDASKNPGTAIQLGLVE